VAFSLSRLPGTDIVLVRGHGGGGIDEADRVIEAVVREWGDAPLRRVIFDVRELDYVPSTPDAQHIASTYSRAARGGDCRMAYVSRPGLQYGMGRMIEMLTEIEGISASSFTTLEDAREWLLGAADFGTMR
jgi:hypothetical protein